MSASMDRCISLSRRMPGRVNEEKLTQSSGESSYDICQDEREVGLEMTWLRRLDFEWRRQSQESGRGEEARGRKTQALDGAYI